HLDKWNYVDTEELAGMKLGIIAEEDIFRKTTKECFTEYYKSLVPWINRLRKVVFPNGGRWKKEDKGLYDSMQKVLLEAQKDVDV
ncbi:hypothetical protein EDB81DRAFT_660381, partial [Dactylonectria macrodidyma]